MKSNLPEIYATVSSVLAMAAAACRQSDCFWMIMNLSLTNRRPIHLSAVVRPQKNLEIKTIAGDLGCERMPLWSQGHEMAPVLKNLAFVVPGSVSV
jgi:hypothetical protein